MAQARRSAPQGTTLRPEDIAAALSQSMKGPATLDRLPPDYQRKMFAPVGIADEMEIDDATGHPISRAKWAWPGLVFEPVQRVYDNFRPNPNGGWLPNLVNKPDDELRKEALSMAADLAGMGGGAALAKGARQGFDPNSVNMFVPAEKSAPLFKKAAEEMERQGVDRYEIYEKTGLFRTKDGVLKGEVSDARATIKEGAAEKFDRKLRAAETVSEAQGNILLPIDEVFEHTRLFDMYPELKNVMVMGGSEPGTGGFIQAGVIHKNPVIRISLDDLANDIDEVRLTMLHELQHGVQKIEGFAVGGNTRSATLTNRGVPEDLLNGMFNQSIEKAAMQFIDGLKQPPSWGTPTPDQATTRELTVQMLENALVTGKYDDLPDVVKDRLLQAAHQDFYWRLAGEVEARLVEGRSPTPGATVRTPPFGSMNENLNAMQPAGGWPSKQAMDEAYEPYVLAGDKGQPSVPEREQVVWFNEGRGPMESAGDFADPDRVNAVKGQFGFDPAERYPKYGKGEVKPKTTGDKKGTYRAKTKSPEGKRIEKAVNAAQRDIDKGNYEPYFDVSQRTDVDPTPFDRPQVSPTAGVLPKKPETIEKWREKVDTHETRQRLVEGYELGLEHAEADEWYFVGQLHDEFVKEYGPMVGPQMFEQRFAIPMAATTGGSTPKDNLRNAAFANFQYNQGNALPKTGQAWMTPPGVGGRYLVENFNQYRKAFGDPPRPGSNFPPPQGAIDPEINPKRYNFSGNFMGFKDPTIDEQMMGYWPGHGEIPATGRYGLYEEVIATVAKQLGVDPRRFQEVAWAGKKAAKEAAKKNPKAWRSQPMIEIVNEAIERTSRITGVAPEEVVRKALVRAEMPLYANNGFPLLLIDREGDFGDRE